MEMFERIAGIIFPVFIIIGVGYAYGKWRGEAVKSDMSAVNRISMEVLCPLLVFSALAAKDFDVAHIGKLIFAGIAISLGSGLWAWPVARLQNKKKHNNVPPM